MNLIPTDMAHYIDANRLREAIDAQRQKMVNALYGITNGNKMGIRVKGMHDAFVDSLAIIDSLQQEQLVVDLEKAALHVYESWMGGTMDNIRRDMAELGKVLNARKEDK